MKHRLCAPLLAVSVASFSSGALPGANTDESGPIDRGRYLVKITGCNDCHASGYAESAPAYLNPGEEAPAPVRWILPPAE